MENIICQTCLSKNRRLIPMEKVMGLIRDVIDTEISDSGGICWECHYTMLKYSKFKLQVHRAQESIFYLVQESKCFSKLSTVSKNHYDYQFSFHSDPYTYEEGVKTVIKSEVLSDTYVNQYDNPDNNDTDELFIDQSPDINTLAETEPFIDNDATNHEDFTSNNTQNDNINSNSDKCPDVSKVQVSAGTRPLSDNDATNHKNLTSDNTQNDNTNSNSNICSEINRVRLYAGIKLFIDNYDTNQEDLTSNDTHNDFLNSNKEDFSSKNTEIDNKDSNEVRLYAGMKTFIDNDDTHRKDSTSNKYTSKKRRIQVDKEELKKKFTVVTYTDEEMQNQRKSKRKQYNFKITPYKCDSCVVGFTKEENFYIHMERKHNQTCPYICAVCLTRFQGKRRLERHIGAHYARYRCKLCKFQTRELWRAAQHCRDRHANDDVGRLHCPHCNKLTKSKKDLALHIKTNHTINCNKCDRKYQATEALRKHTKRVHCADKEQPVYCAECDVQYADNTSYRDHLTKSSNHKKTLFLCSECGSHFSSKAYLSKHHNLHHLNKSAFKCEDCNELLVSADSLRAHMAARHAHRPLQDHACPDCGKKFFTKSVLRNHRLIHSDARSFTCRHCGDTFKQNSTLYNHTRLRHKDVKPSKS